MVYTQLVSSRTWTLWSSHMNLIFVTLNNLFPKILFSHGIRTETLFPAVFPTNYHWWRFLLNLPFSSFTLDWLGNGGCNIFSYFSIRIGLRFESVTTLTTSLWTSNRHVSFSQYNLRGNYRMNSTCMFVHCVIFQTERNWKKRCVSAYSAVQCQYAPLAFSIISLWFVFFMFLYVVVPLLLPLLEQQQP